MLKISPLCRLLSQKCKYLPILTHFTETHHHVAPAVLQAGPHVYPGEPLALLHHRAGVDELGAEGVCLLVSPAVLGPGEAST